MNEPYMFWDEENGRSELHCLGRTLYGDSADTREVMSEIDRLQTEIGRVLNLIAEADRHMGRISDRALFEGRREPARSTPEVKP